MTQNIDTTIAQVNRFNYLTKNNPLYNFPLMTFSERLKKARLRKGWTQAVLAQKAGVAQPTIWHLENNAAGSEHTTRLARLLDVSADWLSEEIGEMVRPQQNQQYQRAEHQDQRIEHVLTVMESLPPYGVDAGVREIDSLADLIRKMQTPLESTPMKSPNIVSIIRDKEKDIIYRITAYRALTYAEKLAEVQAYLAQKKRPKLKNGSTIDIETIIGYDAPGV